MTGDRSIYFFSLFSFVYFLIFLLTGFCDEWGEVPVGLGVRVEFFSSFCLLFFQNYNRFYYPHRSRESVSPVCEIKKTKKQFSFETFRKKFLVCTFSNMLFDQMSLVKQVTVAARG